MRGDVRSILNLAGALAERHDVEVISVRRHKEKPFFPVGPKVAMPGVVDARPGVRHLLPTRPGAHRGGAVAGAAQPQGRRAHHHPAGIERPGGQARAARDAADRARVGPPGGAGADQEVLSAPRRGRHRHRDEPQEEWERLLGGERRVTPCRTRCPPGPGRARGWTTASSRRAAGWVPVKAYDRLIRAFAIVADRAPRLAAAPVRRRPGGAAAARPGPGADLHNHVYFMGTTPDLAGEFAKASIVATPRTARGARA